MYNAVAESFFGTLKAELLADQPGRRFASKNQAIALVGDYIDNFSSTFRGEVHTAWGCSDIVTLLRGHFIQFLDHLSRIRQQYRFLFATQSNASTLVWPFN